MTKPVLSNFRIIVGQIRPDTEFTGKIDDQTQAWTNYLNIFSQKIDLIDHFRSELSNDKKQTTPLKKTIQKQNNNCKQQRQGL